MISIQIHSQIWAARDNLEKAGFSLRTKSLLTQKEGQNVRTKNLQLWYSMPLSPGEHCSGTKPTVCPVGYLIVCSSLLFYLLSLSLSLCPSLSGWPYSLYQWWNGGYNPTSRSTASKLCNPLWMGLLPHRRTIGRHCRGPGVWNRSRWD